MAKALVVDDESDARDFVRAILEGDGWEVAEAADGDAGLQAARAAPPDLIILDVQMPKKDGFLVFGELIGNPETRDCKVIMLTGVREKVGIGFSAGEMGDFIGREPNAYVEKPIDPEAFKRVVANVMDGA
jgi:two-component system alkaline phosphatase synthesis response regulator PhoP